MSAEFRGGFRIGRAESNEVCIKSDFISRTHARVEPREGQWWISDLNSSNGLYVRGERVPGAPVGAELKVALGFGGPVVTLQVLQPDAPAPPVTRAKMESIERYFGKTPGDEAAGEHTVMVRTAFAELQRKQRARFAWLLGAALLLALGAAAYSLHLQGKVRANEALAGDLFYSMKAMDVEIAGVEKMVRDAGNARGIDEVRRLRAQRLDMRAQYDQFLTTLKVYDGKMTPEERLILRVARIFGECELTMPPEFSAEVKNYIGKWRTSGRLSRDVAIAKARNYTRFISREFLAHDLPPQFFYLAMQESDFDPYISGPPTRKGYAKGMWQFIPETAAKYGLRVGPLVGFPRPDPGDDRHHYDLATRAAALYIQDLYRTDAQASGFLVMACYNWGEDRVLPLIRAMPANPRERNFWKLLTKHRAAIPQETYDYVFYIASAAVIGENPRLFGFDFDNPLSGIEAGQ